MRADVHTCSEYAISPLTEQCVTAELHSAKSTTVICDDKRPGLVFILQRSWESVSGERLEMSQRLTVQTAVV